MIIAQHRGVSRRIAPSRPENWLFCIIMTSPSSPRFPFYPASLPLFAHATDSPNVHPLPLLLPPPSRLEISISGFSARFSGKISVITARTLDVQVSVERAPFPAGCVFLIGVGGGGCPDRIVSRERFYATWTDPSFGFRKRDLLENARKFVENAREGRFFAREAVGVEKRGIKICSSEIFYSMNNNRTAGQEYML